jgi:transcriptional regulator with XRE-family HTH domain
MIIRDNFVMGTAGRGRPASEVSIENNFGTWLRDLRTRRGLTGEALAFKTDGKLTQSSISHYERGAKKPEMANVLVLANALGVDPREALSALMADTPGMELSMPTPEISALAVELSQLDVDDQQHILNLIRRLSAARVQRIVEPSPTEQE